MGSVGGVGGSSGAPPPGFGGLDPQVRSILQKLESALAHGTLTIAERQTYANDIENAIGDGPVSNALDQIINGLAGPQPQGDHQL